MDYPNFGPGDMRFRDFSKPWYNDRAEALCVNAIESLIGEPLTSFTFREETPDSSRRAVQIGEKFNIHVNYSPDSAKSGCELQKLINALESQGLFSHAQLEARYNSLLRERPNK